MVDATTVRRTAKNVTTLSMTFEDKLDYTDFGLQYQYLRTVSIFQVDFLAKVFYKVLRKSGI